MKNLPESLRADSFVSRIVGLRSSCNSIQGNLESSLCPAFDFAEGNKKSERFPD